MCDTTPIEWRCDVTDGGLWCVWLMEKSIHPCIHPSIERVKPPVSGMHSLYWPILAKGMSYHGTDKLKPRFNNETRGRGKKKKPLAPTLPPHFQCNCPHWKWVVGTMEFFTIIILLKIWAVWRLLVYLLDSFPGSSAWVVVKHPHLVDVLDKLFHCLVWGVSRVEFRLHRDPLLHPFLTCTFVIHLCELHYYIMPQVS